MPTILHGYTSRKADPGSDNADLITQTQIGLKHALDVNVLSPIVTTSGGKTAYVTRAIATPAANTEFSVALNSATKSFLVKIRDSPGANLQLGDTTGFTTQYITILRGTSYSEGDLLGTSVITLYLKCDKATQTLELLEWI